MLQSKVRLADVPLAGRSSGTECTIEYCGMMTSVTLERAIARVTTTGPTEWEKSPIYWQTGSTRGLRVARELGSCSVVPGSQQGVRASTSRSVNAEKGAELW